MKHNETRAGQTLGDFVAGEQDTQLPMHIAQGLAGCPHPQGDKDTISSLLTGIYSPLHGACRKCLGDRIH